METENTALGQQAGKVTFDASNYRTYLSYEKIQGLSSDQREALFKFASQQTADEKRNDKDNCKYPCLYDPFLHYL